jgi:secondary thiamine-phosphate synthase enzyme
MRDTLSISTDGRGTLDITAQVAQIVADAGIAEGICTVFVHHTSASLIVCENADPTVRADLEAWMERAVPDGDAIFDHTMEGPDDMPAHVRCALTQTSIVLPVSGGRLDLGIWQGLYLYEHRYRSHQRRISVTVVGG